jgi:hypothetical protein
MQCVIYDHQNQLELTFVVVQILYQLISQNKTKQKTKQNKTKQNNNNNNNNNNNVLRTNPKI